VEDLSGIGKYKRAIWWSALVFIFDGIVGGMFALSAWTLVVNLLFRLPVSLLRRKAPSEERKLALRRILLLCLTSALTISYCVLLEHIADERARPVSEAVEKYRENTGAYPKSLDALMPAYLQALPWLKPVLSAPKFKYHLTETGPMLMYASSMWSRPKMYDFKRRVWYTYV